MKISPVICPEQTSFKSSERTRYYTKSNGEYFQNIKEFAEVMKCIEDGLIKVLNEF